MCNEYVHLGAVTGRTSSTLPNTRHLTPLFSIEDEQIVEYDYIRISGLKALGFENDIVYGEVTFREDNIILLEDLGESLNLSDNIDSFRKLSIELLERL